MVFVLERILVERINSADQINLVVICTADCTCHHLIKNKYFLSEMRNLRQIRDFAISNVARFASLNAVFLSWAKTYHIVVICHSDGTYNHPAYFEKNESLRSEPKHMVLVFNDFPPKQLFPIWCNGFFCWKESWSNELIQRIKLTSWLHVPLMVHLTIWLKINIFWPKWEI